MSWIGKVLLVVISLLLIGVIAGVSFFFWTSQKNERERKRRQMEKIASLDNVDSINGIPKIVHQIWIGDRASPPDKWLKTWSEEFMKQNPGYTYVLWRDEDLENLQMHNRALYDAETTLPGKADIARYEILYRYGGVYVDADIVWLGKRLSELSSSPSEPGRIRNLTAGRDAPGTFDQFLNQTDTKSKLFVVCEPFNPENVQHWTAIGVTNSSSSSISTNNDKTCLLYANSIIGASKHNVHILGIIEHIARTYAQRTNEHPAQPWLTTGPFPMTESLKKTDKRGDNGDITVFASSIFYPEDWHADHSTKTVSELRQSHPSAYTFHYGYSTASSSE